jgi:hypothetical protein
VLLALWIKAEFGIKPVGKATHILNRTCNLNPLFLAKRATKRAACIAVARSLR